MSYTTLDQLDGLPRKRTIDNGSARFYKGHTFFYAEDIYKVLEQAEDRENTRLRLVDLTFKRKDGGENHNIEEVVGLALEKIDESGNHKGWHAETALAWPPYYQPDTSAVDDDTGADPDHQGERFEGSMDYKPGIKLDK